MPHEAPRPDDRQTADSILPPAGHLQIELQVTSAPESRNRFVWADSFSLAWGLVLLAESSDCDVYRTFRPHVYDRFEDAEGAEPGPFSGRTLYQVTRTSVPAAASTPAPDGGNYAFVSSSSSWRLMWGSINFDAANHACPDRFSTFPNAAEAVERARHATDEDRSRSESIVFQAYLLTWSVQALQQAQPPHPDRV